MKLDCSYSVTFNGKKLVGRPSNTFTKTRDELQSSHSGDVELYLTKNDFLLALYRKNNIKFLEITSLEDVTITPVGNGDEFEFVIPAKLAKEGECKKVIQGYKNDMKISIRLTLPANVNKVAFGRLIQKVKHLQINLETKPIRRDSTHSTFCSNYFCKCQFCLSKRQNEKREFQASFGKVKEAKIQEEKVFKESEVGKLIASEVEYLEEKLEKYEKEIYDAVMAKEAAVEKLATEKAIFDEVLQQEIQIFEEKLEEQKGMYETQLLEAKKDVKNENENVVQHYEDQLQKERQKREDLQQEKQLNEHRLLNESESYKTIIRQLQNNLERLQREFDQQPKYIATMPQTQGKKVYITATGRKYHADKGCHGLKPANEIWETDSNHVPNLRPCLICRP